MPNLTTSTAIDDFMQSVNAEGMRNAILPIQTGHAGEFLTTNGTNSSWLAVTSGVSSIAGTPNQVIASAPTGAITLSLPQSIATSSSPTFANLTLGSTLFSSRITLATGVLLAAPGESSIDFIARSLFQSNGFSTFDWEGGFLADDDGNPDINLFTREAVDSSGGVALNWDTRTLSGTWTIPGYAPSALTSAHLFVGSAGNVATDVALSGDATLANTGALTLATVNSDVGTFGSSTSIPTFTVNAKGLITAASGNAVVAPAGTLSGATLAAGVTASSLTSAAGGTFGTNAFTSTAYAPLDSPTFTGTPSGPSWAITGTGGLGFVSFVPQSSPPSAPATGFLEFADASGRMSWLRASDGFIRTWDATLTANRVYTLPDASMTLAGLETANTFTGLNSFTKKLTLGSTQSAAAWTNTGLFLAIPTGFSVTDTTSSGTVALQILNRFSSATLLASSATTYTDSINILISGPLVASTNVTQTRTHSLAISDSTAAASSITGAFIVATAIGTAATSVGIGGGNINAGGTITAAGVLSSTGASNISSGSGYTLAAASFVVWTGQSRIGSTADGKITFTNQAQTGFTVLQVGRTTNSGGGIGWDAANGFTLQSAASTATWNDQSTATSGTVADRYLWGIATPTLTATNATVTYTRASSFFIGGAPVASTNVSIGTAYALQVAGGTSIFGGTVILAGGASLLTTTSALTDASGAGLGTLANAPTAGNPTKWIAFNDAGVTRKFPTWT
jgi:hypothetical protein